MSTCPLSKQMHAFSSRVQNRAALWMHSMLTEQRQCCSFTKIDYSIEVHPMDISGFATQLFKQGPAGHLPSLWQLHLYNNGILSGLDGLPALQVKPFLCMVCSGEHCCCGYLNIGLAYLLGMAEGQFRSQAPRRAITSLWMISM